VECLAVTTRLEEAFRGRKVLVTGHTGFMGSWLVLWLERLGAVVSGLALDPPTRPNNFELSGVGECLSHDLRGDVADLAVPSGVIEALQPDVVFHLAAQSLVRDGYREPITTFGTNVMGTASVLEAIRRSGRRCVVVIATSDKCYENRGRPQGLREDDPMGGADPYSASKGCAELVVASYRRSYFPPERAQEHGVRLASVRAGNAIGGGDWSKDRIVVDAIEALVAGRPIPVRNPRSVRPFQHVIEPLAGYLMLAAGLLTASDSRLDGAFNFGPRARDAVEVQYLVEEILAAWGSGTWQDGSTPGQPPEAGSLRLSARKAERLLGWRPRWRTSEAIRRTVAWYRQYHAGKGVRMRAACLADIDAYEDALRSTR
jgi:CDP-glucose 4,6-dehydratase